LSALSVTSKPCLNAIEDILFRRERLWWILGKEENDLKGKNDGKIGDQNHETKRGNWVTIQLFWRAENGLWQHSQFRW
jgi:hypothetical protein